MKLLSDDEMIWLNALADDELSGADKRLWLDRIQTDTETRRVYESILFVKSNLNKHSIKTSAARTRTAAISENRNVFWKLAASFIFVFLLGGTALYWFDLQSKSTFHIANNNDESKIQSPLEWHLKFSQSNYDISTTSRPVLAFALDKPYLKIPDLKLSGLILVASKLLTQSAEKKVQLLHYRGSRGCRLTLWYGPATQQQDKINKPINSKHWTVRDTQVWVLASGMDSNRFVSITDYIQIFNSPTQPTQKLLASKKSMGKVYKEAQTCA